MPSGASRLARGPIVGRLLVLVPLPPQPHHWLDDPRDALALADQQRWAHLRLEASCDEVMSTLSGSQRGKLRDKLKRFPVDTLLFSAGGNDLVGPDLLPLLREHTAGVTAEECLVEDRFERRLRQIRDCHLELINLCADGRPELTISAHGCNR